MDKFDTEEEAMDAADRHVVEGGLSFGKFDTEEEAMDAADRDVVAYPDAAGEWQSCTAS